MYGTAWKEERTEALTRAALGAGFRAIDTANQRRHYVEASVGNAVRAAIAAGELTRGEVFLQTKFTHLGGQDHRLPYDPKADLATQVRQSFESSLEHLHTTYIDSYVLHGPSSRSGLPASDWVVWRAMEELQRAGTARLIGVSNVSLAQLAGLHADAAVKPAIVQNRCFASTGWDRDVRAFCAAHDITYQGFSLLTANADVVRSSLVGRIAARVGGSPAAVIFRFAIQAGMLPLTGATNPEHLRDDLACFDFELSAGEVISLEQLAG